MQAFFWEMVRAFTKFGIAIAARRPMMATTIIISTSVKPDLWCALIFILLLPFSCGGVDETEGGLIIITASVHRLPSVDRGFL